LPFIARFLSAAELVVESSGEGRTGKTENNEEKLRGELVRLGYDSGDAKQMLDTIPKLKELGIHWATLDDGWFNNYGESQSR